MMTWKGTTHTKWLQIELLTALPNCGHISFFFVFWNLDEWSQSSQFLPLLSQHENSPNFIYFRPMRLTGFENFSFEMCWVMRLGTSSTWKLPVDHKACLKMNITIQRVFALFHSPLPLSEIGYCILQARHCKHHVRFKTWLSVCLFITVIVALGRLSWRRQE